MKKLPSISLHGPCSSRGCDEPPHSLRTPFWTYQARGRPGVVCLRSVDDSSLRLGQSTRATSPGQVLELAESMSKSNEHVDPPFLSAPIV